MDNDFTISEYDWSEIWSDPDRKFGPEEVEDTIHQHRQPGWSGYAEMDLVAVVKLTDNRFGSIHAGTDTTGWGCHGDYVRWYVGPNLEDVIFNGLTNESRGWLGLEIE